MFISGKARTYDTVRRVLIQCRSPNFKQDLADGEGMDCERLVGTVTTVDELDDYHLGLRPPQR
jgi:hypothetical protein